LLKLSVRSAVSEFQMVGPAWQNARLPKTVLAPAPLYIGFTILYRRTLIDTAPL